MTEIPTIVEVHSKLVDVLELNDVVQSDIAEIKKLLKSLVELQLNLKDSKDLLHTSLDDGDSMFS
jgi:rhamnogalacturonyl hydrolase YesR